MRFSGEGAPWGIGHALVALLGIYIVGGVYWYYSPAITDYLLYRWGFPATDIEVFCFGYMVRFVIMGAVIAGIMTAVRARPPHLGFTGDNVKQSLVYGTFWGIVLFAAVILASQIIKYFVPNLPPQEPEMLLRQATSIGEFAALFIIVAIIGPLFEEVLYRGILYTAFRNRIGVPWGMVVSGIIFGVAHGDVWRFLPLTLGGIALAYIYERSGNIYTPWIAHGVWNGIVAVGVYLAL